MRSHCVITMESLLDLREGRLNAAGEIALRTHIASGCTACAANLRWLEQTLPGLPDAFAPVPEPSPAAIQYANSLARLLQSAPTEKHWVRHVAQLITGGSRPLAHLGARGASAQPVQRVFETTIHRITLWDEPDGEKDRYLIGQVYARDGGLRIPQSTLLLMPDGTEQAAEHEGSEFHLAAISPGTYLIRCFLENREEVLLPGVDIGVG